MSEENEIDETYSEDGPECPYCHHVADSADLHVQDNWTRTCGNCEREYEVTGEASFYWRCSPLEAQP